jgi:hypothetical protein
MDAAAATNAGWRVRALPLDHLAILTAPDQVAGALVEIADDQRR